MMIYRVDISPAAKEELIIYVEGGIESGEDIPEKILDAFDKVIDTCCAWLRCIHCGINSCSGV